MRTVLDRPGRPVLQVIFAGSSEEAWRDSARGLLPRDLTMNIVLPEVDGRLTTRAVSFKAETYDPATDSRTTTYRPVADRVAFVAEQAARWVRLAAKPAGERRIALVLSNYPNRDGRIGNGVGLDTPESTVGIAAMMRDAGYALPGFPETGRDLMALLLSGPRTNCRREPRQRPTSPLRGSVEIASDFGRGATRSDIELPIADYLAFFAALPEEVRDDLTERWGPPEDDPHFSGGAFHLAIHRFGNVVVGIQPARGYNIDPKATYHDPDLVPPHHYLAFYAWLRRSFAADAMVHVGKHGNLEWLPGKALGLSQTCWPEVALGTTPLVYPFIVNDPGEGAQAKRRASAVIVDHLMPAMTRAEIHGPLAELETLIDEYYLAVGVDPRRRDWLAKEIVATAERHGLDRDLGLTRDSGGEALRALDAHLCELKEMQIRDGLHILGTSPQGRQRIDTLVAIARVPRTGKRPADASLHRAIAADLGLAGFDPLDCDLAAEWQGPRPAPLADLSDAPWRSAGDTVERIETLAARLVAGDDCAGITREDMPATFAVLDWIAETLAPALDSSGQNETAAVRACSRRAFRPARTLRSPDQRPPGRDSDRPQFLLGRRPRRPHRRRLGARPRRRRRHGAPLFPRPWRLAEVDCAVGLEHLQHADRRRRHRPGDGADRRGTPMGTRHWPGDRVPGDGAFRARPAAYRRYAEDLRHVPRCLSRPDRPDRFRRPRHCRAGGGRDRQPDRRRRARGRGPDGRWNGR